MVTTPDQKFTFDLNGPLTQEQAEFIYALGREAVIYALMILSAREASNNKNQAMTPSTPSGMIPVYEKTATPKRRKKPGAKAGHQGHYRQLPPVTHYQEHPPLTRCPDCGQPFGEPSERRTRVIEDIADMEPVVTEHTIPAALVPASVKRCLNRRCRMPYQKQLSAIGW